MMTKALLSCLVLIAVTGSAPRVGRAGESGRPASGAPAAVKQPDKKPAPNAARPSPSTETTLTGEMTCSKCGLHESAKCQNVLRVKDAAGKETKYYLEKNAVSESEHEKVCGGAAPATVTGKVSEKGGKKVLAASSVKFD